MNTNPFKPGDKVRLTERRYDSGCYSLYSFKNPEILTIEDVSGSLVKLYEVEGKYIYTRFKLASIDKPVEKTFEVGKRYKSRNSISICLFTGNQITTLLVNNFSLGKEYELAVLNSDFHFYEELPEEITCERVLLVLKPKDPLSSNLNVTQSLHVTLQSARNGFSNEYKLKYNLEAAFESNYNNGKIEMVDITEKFKEACGISS